MINTKIININILSGGHIEGLLWYFLILLNYNRWLKFNKTSRIIIKVNLLIILIVKMSGFNFPYKKL